ncbi:MAG: hypothetical protein ACE5MH_04110 [Terriglobia bacterium]
MKKLGVGLIGLLLCGGITLALAQSQSQEKSLGEIARKLRAKKKTRAVKVYTNDDLARLRRGGISVVGRAGAASPATASGETPAARAGEEAAATGEAPPEEAATEEKDEQYWRGKFAEMRNKIAMAEKELDLLQREWQLQRNQYSQDPNTTLRQETLGQQPGGKLNELREKIQEKQAEIEQFQQEMAELENELRRAGGNPGWARP